MRINTCTFHQLSGSVVDFPRLHELTLDLFFPGRLNVTYLLDLPFQLFTAAPHLQRLDLSVGPFLRPTQVFLPWKQLTDISMYIPQPNGWLAHLVHCASLRVLRLRGGARPLGDVFLCFPHLTHLARSQCTVRTACFYLDALSLSVGDASLLQLAVLQSLEVLSDVTSLEVLGTFTPPLLHPLLLNLVCKDQIHLWDEQPEGPPPFRLVPKLERLTLYPTKQLNVHSWDMTFILRFAESRRLLISRNGDAHWGHRVGGPRTFHTLRLGFAPGQVRYSNLRVVGFGKNMKYVSDEWDVYSGQKPYDDMMRLKRVAASHEETICDLMGKGLDVVFSAQLVEALARKESSAVYVEVPHTRFSTEVYRHLVLCVTRRRARYRVTLAASTASRTPRSGRNATAQTVGTASSAAGTIRGVWQEVEEAAAC
ncbi:hypothetical protein FISHEDRAFT_59372 [Fistulina hepatica ATCC 64428]|uniref:Uncharacterized protein n=1 Tax=Fistulina hepatica ATCC 64428 TaxID=1128425 RepID=A0A0D7AA83_9AGAR|nr:hypothetical protein FISHEDRAFT_59372 [Fistulina hepatica ATCC 64428]